MGVLYARSKLHLVDTITGEAGVSECGLIKEDGPSAPVLAVAPATTPATVPITTSAATPAAMTTKPTSEPAVETKPIAADPSPQPTSPVAPVEPAPVIARSSQDTAASAAIEPIAQSVATQLSCGVVQANGATTFIAPCGTYSVLIDCDSGQCRPMHTVNVKHDE